MTGCTTPDASSRSSRISRREVPNKRRRFDPSSPVLSVRTSYLGANYTNGKHLGAGDFGEVFSVFCNKTNESFAVKQFKLNTMQVTAQNFTKTHLEEFDPSSPVLSVLTLYLGANYTNGKHLGAGDFGEVFSVSCNKTNESYAVKQFKVNTLQVMAQNFTKTHLEEVRIHKSIPSHPNLASFYVAWREEKNLYLMMELCDTSLERYWKEVNAINQELQRVLVDSILALHHLHSHRFIHLDIKPANILRTAEGLYKLTDFGVTVHLDKENLSHSEMGTGRFAAPELFDHIFTTKADIYSLGITLAQVSIPANSPLTDEECNELRNEGNLPIRISEVLLGPLGLDSKIQSMIDRNLITRPSADLLLASIGDSNAFGKTLFDSSENTFLGVVAKGARLSLPAMKLEEKSPRFKKNKNPDVIFDTDNGFFEMPQQMGMRHSLPPRKSRLRFEDD